MSTERLVLALLRLYPTGVRARYGAEMLAFHRERVREGVPLHHWAVIVVDHVVTLAALLPARRATRVDPTDALRGG